MCGERRAFAPNLFKEEKMSRKVLFVSLFVMLVIGLSIAVANAQ